MSFEIGDAVPAFTLPDTEGVEHSVPIDDAPDATVVIMMCNHCPFVQAWNPRVAAVAKEYTPRGVRFLAINANDAERYPADSLEHMRRFAREQAWPMPYLHDEAQDAVRSLGAERTPHVFVLDGDQRLAYRGAPDADHGDESLRAEWLRAALDAVLAGDEVERAETPAKGCSVKWREP